MQLQGARARRGQPQARARGRDRRARARDRADLVRPGGGPGTLAEAERLDLALYRAVAGTRTPTLDTAFSRLSSAADYSRLSIGHRPRACPRRGPAGRRAAGRGMASVGVTAAVVNLAFKPITRRQRPDRTRLFTTCTTRRQNARVALVSIGPYGCRLCIRDRRRPGASWVGPGSSLAALVGYSRVHTGVHYPLDVIVGGLAGMALGELTNGPASIATPQHGSAPTSPRECRCPPRLSCSR